MKTWYKAVCDEHKMFCDMFVNNPVCTAHYLGDDRENDKINDFLSNHYACKLRLVHRDIDLDFLFDNDYKDWMREEKAGK